MAGSRAPTFRGLPEPARIYITAILLLAASLAALRIAGSPGPELDPGLFAAAAILCAAGNLFEVFAPANFSFQPNLVVFFAAVLLLPPWAGLALAAFCFLPGWLVHRFPWYMVAFNVANYVVGAVAAMAIMGVGDELGPAWAPGLADTVVLALAAVAFVVINHNLIIGVVTLSRGRTLRKSAVDMLTVVPIDIALAVTGACLVALWTSSAPLTLLAAGPMFLIYRALWVPLLTHKSRTDPKTGLYNSEYFSKVLDDSLAAAKRTNGALSIVMIDLDQLRQVNNRHGHLAGDRLISAVASVVLKAAGDHEGIAARLGGDELCVLLPHDTFISARATAEELRNQIDELQLALDGDAWLGITISAGVASYPEHADTVEKLLGAADVAVYDAKLGGRNRVRAALPSGVQSALAHDLTAPVRQPAPPAIGMPPVSFPLEHDRLPLEPERPLEGLPAADPSEPQTASGSEAQPEPEGPKAASSRLIPVYIGILCAAAAAFALLSDRAAIGQDPWLFVLLVSSVVVLDAVRIDVFERANMSPAAVPVLALAFFFGPLGPIAGEVLIAAGRFARREPLLKWSFDLGGLSLAGAAAAGVFALVSDPSSGLLLVIAALAGGAYYAVNSALLAIVMALAEGRGPIAVWSERLAWMVPHYVIFGLLAGTFVICEQSLGLSAFALFGLPMLMLWIAEKQYLDRSRSTVTELRGKNDELEGANQHLRLLLDENRELLGRMHNSYVSTITSLARTVEAKDPYTSGHTERVAEIAMLLAAELGIEPAELPAINVGAIIHDIGKIGIPDQILLKPGPLTDEETAEMRRHPEISSYIVAELELPPAVKQMVRSHHERFDGDGYPDRLVGEEIPLAARILTVADTLDAMTSDRPYRKALPLEVARAEIQAKAGTQFCPKVVAGLTNAMDNNPEFWSIFRGEASEPGADSAPAGLADAPTAAPGTDGDSKKPPSPALR